VLAAPSGLQGLLARIEALFRRRSPALRVAPRVPVDE
jgi:hypothetical protein